MVPWTASWSVRDARDAYLAENGFSIASYDDTRVRLSFFRFSFVVPNPPSRRRAIPFHDLHHVATGYGTDLVGEAEVAAWEIGCGFGKLGLYPRMLVTSVFLTGLVLAPRRTFRAWRAAHGSRSLFYEDVGPDDRIATYDDLLAMSVGSFRGLLGVAPDGLASESRRLHPLAPK